jgi:predicted ATPase/DNA-binding XRE family transcriptional regulator/tetratricopeptide (TPR) repeat protein
VPSEAAFSDLLREHRRTAGYSQEDLAERASLSVGAVRSLEQGSRRAPHRDTVRALAVALDLSNAARNELEDAAARARGRRPRGDPGVPILLTSFVERSDVNELQSRLESQRLVTITGSGGVGKTRTAIEVVRRVETRYDEVWFVDLLPVRAGSLVNTHIAGRLKVLLEGEDELSTIAARLGSHSTLLVIDNCEHVITEAASLVGELLRRCPSLTILTTSRESLAISGEWTYRLPSLDLATASNLFVERVRATDHDFVADAQADTIIEEICKDLNCIPLAIELAASRASSLGLHTLCKRLKSGMTLTGTRDIPLRHQTMDAAIAWSYDLLNESERLLFQRLSVFFGGFTLEAAENVCADAALPRATIADRLIRLVEKSLINVESSTVATRYRFLDSIRTFAWNRLSDSAQVESTMLRLIEWFIEKSAPLESTSPSALFAELRAELDTIAAAMNWALSGADYAAIVTAARLLIGTWRVWPGLSRQQEVRAYGLGLFAALRDDENPEIVGLLTYSISAFVTPAETVELSKRAIPLLIATGHNAHAAALHARSALVECQRGVVAAAREHLTNATALMNSSEQRGSRAAGVFATHAAYARLLLEDSAGARALLDAVVLSPGDPLEADISVVLAAIEVAEGHLQKATEILQSAKLLLGPSPIARDRAIMVSGNLAEYYMRVGNEREAEEELREALTAIVDQRPPLAAITVADLGLYAAFFAATSGRIELASRLCGACERRKNPDSLDDDGTPRQLAATAIAKQLSPERAEALRRSGASEDIFELLEEFLDQPTAGGT